MVEDVEDSGSGFGSDEGFGPFVVFGDVTFDGGLQVDEAGEGPASQPAAREGGEEAFDRVEPLGGCRGEVEGPAWMADEPSADLWVLIHGVVIQDNVDELARRRGRLDHVEEADELAVAMALHAASEHGSLQDVQGGKQGRGAVAGIVVGLGGGIAGAERPVGTGALQGLDLGLLVDGEHDRMVGGPM